MSNNTFFLRKEDRQPQWLLFDAAGKTLGRLAAEIAKVLRGKHKPTFTPHVDGGDGVIVINAKKIQLTGNKEAQIEYRHHTGFRQKVIPFRVMKERKPDYIIRHAVKGMMPKGILGRSQMKRLRVFAGEQHNMEAQKPQTVNI